jgi:hypothetical protein
MSLLLKTSVTVGTFPFRVRSNHGHRITPLSVAAAAKGFGFSDVRLSKGGRAHMSDTVTRRTDESAEIETDLDLPVTQPIDIIDLAHDPTGANSRSNPEGISW